MFSNLAGHRDCDYYIERELLRCGINLLHLDKPANSEVAYTISGEFGRFTFERAWRYYIVKGKMPLALAKELYKNKVCKTDVRVAGHCGCPPPEEWATYYHKVSGRRLLTIEEKLSTEKYLTSSSDYMRETANRVLAENDFAEDREAVGNGYIEMYHVDSELGLYLLVQQIKKAYGEKQI